jgi:ubiquinone/menaquinone biosynthesis C-methylase UbiE
MQHEPSRFEIFLTRLAFLFYGKSVYKTFADRLPLNGSERVLDFGCGMGTVAHYTAKRLTHGHITCLDISERWLKMCRKALRGFSNVDFAHAETLTLSGDSFDLVYCHFVLHDVAEDALETVITALVNCLKSGGTIVFREPLNEAKKLNIIKRLMVQNKLLLKNSRVTDVPLMGNALESAYIKK